MPLDVLELGLEPLDPAADDPAVGLQLGLARAPEADAAADTREVGPHPGQPGQQVFQLRQLHLQLGLVAPGPGGEDVEDDLGPVHHPHLELALEVGALHRAQLFVEDDQRGARRPRPRGPPPRPCLRRSAWRDWVTAICWEMRPTTSAPAVSTSRVSSSRCSVTCRASLDPLRGAATSTARSIGSRTSIGVLLMASWSLAAQRPVAAGCAPDAAERHAAFPGERNALGAPRCLDRQSVPSSRTESRP